MIIYIYDKFFYNFIASQANVNAVSMFSSFSSKSWHKFGLARAVSG